MAIKIVSMEVTLHSKTDAEVLVCSRGGQGWQKGALEKLGFSKVPGEVRPALSSMLLDDIHHKNIPGNDTIKLPLMVNNNIGGTCFNLVGQFGANILIFAR